MQGLDLIDSRSDFIPQSGKAIDVPHLSGNLYSTLQQEVHLGGQALERESADMAVTLFQSALQKLTVDQPFYDHLVHNLLLSYKLLIEKLLKQGDTSTAKIAGTAAKNAFGVSSPFLALLVGGQQSSSAPNHKGRAGKQKNKSQHERIERRTTRKPIVKTRAAGNRVRSMTLTSRSRNLTPKRQRR